MQCQHPKTVDLERLRQKIARLEGSRRWREAAVLSSGCEALDRMLPDGGFHPGTLVEWLAEDQASGAVTLALRAACEACGRQGTLVVLDRRGEFYPPAAARLGVDLERMILVRAANDADDAWALDQSLRCPGVAAVLAWPARLDGRAFRRLQLAAKAGGGLGLLVRPAAAEHEPSWADVRLRVAAACGLAVRITLLRSRGLTVPRTLDVEIDDAAHLVRLVARA